MIHDENGSSEEIAQDPWAKIKPRGNTLPIQTGVPVDMVEKLRFVGEMLVESGEIEKHTVWSVSSWCIKAAVNLLYDQAMKKLQEEGHLAST